MKLREVLVVLGGVGYVWAWYPGPDTMLTLLSNGIEWVSSLI